VQVWVDVEVGAGFARALPVALDVRAYRQAWVARQDVPVGRSIDVGLLEQREVDIAALRGEPLVELPSRARLGRPLLAGQALTRAHVQELPAVARGSEITLRRRAGAVAIEARAEALQDGGEGQWVWVRVATSSGPLRARVVGASSVEVRDE
jgi:flagella basal body P-ring formation protein FlgA